jgi:hypothetical protein
MAFLLDIPRATGASALFLLLAACSGSVSSAPADGGAPTPDGGTIPDGSLVGPSCARPPAVLSLGSYPASVEVGAQSEYALRGKISVVGMDPPACGATSIPQDSFTIDARVWGDYPPVNGDIGVDDQSFTVGQELLILDSGGTFAGDPSGCFVVDAEQALDLASYPNAPADMLALRAFEAARADYDALIAAAVVADVTVLSAGPKVYPGPDRYTVDLTVNVDSVLCGDATAVTSVRYEASVDGGASNPAGSTAPSAGDHLVMLLDGAAPRQLLQVFTADQWARLQALFASPPHLSL